jgi:hypothetical protein
VVVPRYYFHLFNDVTAIDEEGVDLPNEAAALHQAKADARHMAAQSVEEGHLILDHHIDVSDERGNKVGTVYFKDVVEIKQFASG